MCLPSPRHCAHTSPIRKVQCHSPKISMDHHLPVTHGDLAQRAARTGPRLRATAFQGPYCALSLEKQNPGTLGPCSGRSCMAPHHCPPPMSTPGTDGGSGHGSWEMPGPTMLTLRPLSAEPALTTSCPGDVSSGQKKGSLGVGD